MNYQALAVCFAAVIPFSLCGLGYASEEECIFDQDEQEQAYVELEKKFPGSEYIADQYKLVIPEDGDQVTLRRGGCVHFGIFIEFRTTATQRYDKEDDFLLKVTDLVDKYGLNLVEPGMLEKSIKAENWDFTELEDGVYYFLYYPDATFEIWRRHDQEYTVIGVSFYY